MDKQYDVFISYGRKDYEIEYQENGNTVKKLIPNNPILQIVEALNEAGISCWYDQEGVSAEFLKYIKQKIESSRVMIFVSSQYSNQSVYTADEIARALQLKMPIIPFKIDKTEFNEDFALGLASKNTIDIFMTNPKKALADLVKCVQKSLEQVHKKEAKELREKQEEIRRAEEARIKKEQEQRRLEELNDKNAELQDVQDQLLKARNRCEELELKEKNLKEAIKRLETPTPQPIPRKYYYILIAICLFIITALLWIFIPRESKLTVSTHEIACSYRDTIVDIIVSSNVDWKIRPTEGVIYSAAKENDSIARITISQNRSMALRSDYLTILTERENVIETIQIQQEKAPQPKIIIKDIRINYNVTQDGLLGANIRLYLNTSYLQNDTCLATAYFITTDRQYIKSSNPQYSTAGGNLACWKKFVPKDEIGQVECTLFMPYSELAGKANRGYIVIQVDGSKSRRVTVQSSSEFRVPVQK